MPCGFGPRMSALPGMLNGVGDEQPSVYQVARQVVVNVTAELAGYLVRQQPFGL